MHLIPVFKLHLSRTLSRNRSFVPKTVLNTAENQSSRVSFPLTPRHITKHHYRRQWNVPFTLWWTLLVEVFHSAMSAHIFRMDDTLGNQCCDLTLTKPQLPTMAFFPAAIVRWIANKCYVISQGMVLVDKKTATHSQVLCSSLTPVSE